MIECPSCGADNTDDSRFCEECGAQLPQGSGAVAVATREGPLAEGALVDGRFTVTRALYGCRIHRYQAGEQLLLEGPEGDRDLLSEQKKRLGDVETELLWRPTEACRWENRDYLVGPMPAGRTLAEHVDQDGPLGADMVHEIGLKLAGLLGAMHAAHLLSRSIQPDRVFADDDGNLVVDAFGRVCAKGGNSESYEVTPGFSPPECYGMQGGQVDERSDIFSLGALLHYCLTGKRTDLESRETFFVFPRPQAEAPVALVDTIMKAVSKAPEARFATAADFVRALEGQPVPTPAPKPTPAPRPAPAAAATAAAPNEPATSEPVGAYTVAMLSNIGCVRSINQDACLELRFTSVEKSNNREGHLVAVIDGMGGEAEGDKAASLALRAIAQEVVSLSLSLRNGRHTAPLMPDDATEKNRFIIQRALEVANRTIHEYASLDRARQGMGCTITAALFDGPTAVFGHVGDTRAYLYRGGLDQITTDHSLVGRLVEMGQMTPEEARNSPQRSIIYRAMGTNPEVEVDVYERKLEVGDYVMMSSDGVWEYFEQGELKAVFDRLTDPHEICEELVRICLERGADDNATVAIVHALGSA